MMRYQQDPETLHRLRASYRFKDPKQTRWREQWIAFTDRRFDPDHTYRQKSGIKPNGFWFGLGLNWFESQIYSGNPMRYMYAVTPKEGVRLVRATKILAQQSQGKKQIVVLENRADLNAFHERFSDPRFAAFLQDQQGQIASVIIRWAAVKKEFAGIILRDPRLLPGWDIVSGCVWDTSVVEVELLAQKQQQRQKTQGRWS